MKKLLFLLILISVPSYAVDITITIDDAVAQRALKAYCDRFNYQDTIEDPSNRSLRIPNPVTRIQFFRSTLGDYIKGIVVSEEAKTAARIAQDQSLISGQQQINISVR